MAQLSYNQLTELTGFSFRTLKKRMVGLQPVGTSKTKANLWESTEALPLIYAWKDKSKGSDGANHTENLTLERALLAKEQRKGQEIKNAKEIGELIPADQVQSGWMRIVSAIKRQLLSLPGRLVQMLETAKSKEDKRKVIEKEIHSILEGLAEGVE